MKSEELWELVSDSMENPQMLLPKEMNSLIEFAKQEVTFSGSNSELADKYNAYSGEALSAKSLKQMMNRWRYKLEEYGIVFRSHRSSGLRLVEVKYFPPSVSGDASAVSDERKTVWESCGTCVPCDPLPPCGPLLGDFGEIQNEDGKTHDRARKRRISAQKRRV